MMEKLENSKTFYTIGIFIFIFRETKVGVKEKRECEGTIGFPKFSWKSKGFCHLLSTPRLLALKNVVAKFSLLSNSLSPLSLKE